MNKGKERMANQSITIPHDLLNRAKETAKKQHRSFSGLVSFVLEEYLSHLQNEQNKNDTK